MRVLILVLMAVLLSGCAHRHCPNCNRLREKLDRVESYAAELENEQEAMAECWHLAEARAAKAMIQLRRVTQSNGH